MMSKIYFGVVVVLLGWGAFWYCLATYRGNKIDTLTRQISELNADLKRCKNEIVKSNEAQCRADETISQIKTVVKTVKSPCDCYNSAIEPAILNRVRGK